MAVQNPERYASSENLSPIFQKIETKLQNRYTKAQTDSAIASAISGVTEFDYQIVQSLPQEGTKGIIYLVPNSGAGSNLYNEYIWIVVEGTGSFELFGAKEISVANKLENADVKVGNAVSKTNDQSGNGFTLEAVPAPLGGIVIDDGSDPSSNGAGLKLDADGTTIVVDPVTGKVKISDDYQVDVQPLTTEQVNTLKAIFTDDPVANSGD